MRKPSRIISALGTSLLWNLGSGLVTLGIVGLLYAVSPPLVVAALPVIQAVNMVIGIAGLVVGWKRASQQIRDMETVERQAGVAPARQEEIEPVRSAAKSFVKALRAERSEEPPTHTR